MDINTGGIMDINTWSKTILSVYNHLENITKSIDNIVYTKAINSHNYYGNNDVLVLAEKITELTKRKIKLINLKVLTDQILSEMEKLQAKILILKFFYQFSTERILSIMNLSERSFYRKINEALVAFSTICEKKGFNCEKLYSIYGSEGWIIEVFNNLFLQKNKNGRPGTINFFDELFLNKIYKSYKKPPKIISVLAN